MKNTVSTILLIASIATTANAQFAFEGGLNAANLSLKSGGTSLATQYRYGESIGICAGLALDDAQHIYFEPGLFFQANGAKVAGPPAREYVLNTINIPFNLEYKSGLRCGARWFFGAGPYICNILSGTYHVDAYGPLPAVDAAFVIAPTNGFDLKKYEVGAGLNFGYLSRKHFFLRAHYQMGFSNMLPNGDAQNSFKQQSGGLTIGYAIRGCNKGSRHGSFGNRGNDHWRGIKKLKWSRHQYNWKPHGPGY